MQNVNKFKKLLRVKLNKVKIISFMLNLSDTLTYIDSLLHCMTMVLFIIYLIWSSSMFENTLKYAFIISKSKNMHL